jgi:hypothetical protein
VKIQNFYAWRNFDYGFLSLTSATVELDNFVLVDNGVGVLTQGTGPAADKHDINEDLHVTVKNTVIVATSDLYDCAHDQLPFTYTFRVHNKRKWSERFNGLEGKFHHSGIVMPIFMSKYPKEFKKLGMYIAMNLTAQEAIIRTSKSGGRPWVTGVMNVDESKY